MLLHPAAGPPVPQYRHEEHINDGNTTLGVLRISQAGEYNTQCKTADWFGVTGDTKNAGHAMHNHADEMKPVHISGVVLR